MWRVSAKRWSGRHQPAFEFSNQLRSAITRYLILSRRSSVTNLAVCVFVRTSLRRAHQRFFTIEQKVTRRMSYFAADVTF